MLPETFTRDIQVAMEQSLDFPALRRVVHTHVAEALADARIANAKRIVIGGSGDSWFSALCVAPAFRRWAGVMTEARTAMELARYEIPLLGPDDLVISVSNSGSSSRAREAVLLAKSRGVPLENYDIPGGQKSASGAVTAGGAKAAWFKDSEGNIMAIVQNLS